MLAAAATFSACSSSDDIATDDSGTNGQTNAYMKISIADPSTRGLTRTDGDLFDEKETEENQITSLRLFFFDKNGNKYAINDKGTNSIDVTDGLSTTDNASENTVAAYTGEIQLVVKNGSEKPAKLIAVANFKNLKDFPEDATLSDLTAKTGTDYYKFDTPTTGSKPTNFLMTNSVWNNYNNSTNNVINYTDIDANSIADNKSQATATNIYLERVLAKVKTQFASKFISSSNSDLFTHFILKDANESGIKYIDDASSETNKEVQLYVKVKGWDLDTKSTKSYLIKNLTPNNASVSYPDSLNWNDYKNHRSYWATSVPFVNGSYSPAYVSYNKVSKTKADTTYCQENVPTAADSTNTTKLLVAAELGKLGNNTTFSAVSLAKWRGTLYDSLTCKSRIAAAINNRIQVATDNAGTNAANATLTGTNLYYADAKLETITGNTGKRYMAKLVVNGTSGLPTSGYYKIDGGKWTKITDNSANVKKSIDSLLVGATSNTYAPSATSDYYVQLFNGGRTYYYINIKHLFSSDLSKIGAYGIVRNHTYTLSIEDIVGTGTPVPDDGTDEIIPETPENDKVTYMKAKINVNSWRIVPTQKVTLK